MSDLRIICRGPEFLDRQAQASYCDLCDEPKGEAVQYWMYGLETWVCEKCRNDGEMDGEDEQP
jgi:hypothetical protein